MALTVYISTQTTVRLPQLGSWDPEAVLVVDLNSDGTDDVVIDYGAEGLYKYVNDTTFIKMGSWSPEAVIAADLDNDGIKDDLIIDYGTNGLYKCTNGSTFTLMGSWNALSLTVADLDSNGIDDIVIDYGTNGLYKYMNNSAFVQIGSWSPESINVADLDGNGIDDLIINYGSNGLYKYMNNSTFTQIGSWTEDLVTTELGYANTDYTGLVYTSTYNSSGNLTDQTFEEQLAWWGDPGESLLKRKIVGSTGDVYEYENDETHAVDNVGRMLLSSSHEEVTLGGLYATSDWYTAYTWDPPEGAGVVVVAEYDGEYSVAIDEADVKTDVLPTQLRVAYSFLHNDWYDLLTASDHWQILGKGIYDTDGEGVGNLIEGYHWYSEAGSTYTGRAEDLMKSYDASTGLATEWEDPTDGHKVVGIATYTDVEHDLVEGVYTGVTDWYQTYDWDFAEGQVMVRAYDGEYAVSEEWAIQTDIDDTEVRVGYVYDHGDEFTNLDADHDSGTYNGWVMRQQSVYTTGEPYMTVTGDAYMSTTQKKFGTSSAYFGAVDGNELVAPYHSEYDFAEGEDFTIELQVRWETTPTSHYDLAGTGYSDGWGIYGSGSSDGLYFYADGSNVVWGDFDPQGGQWYHIAVVRNSDTITIYVDGTELHQGETPCSTTYLSAIVNGDSDGLHIGNDPDDDYYLDTSGWIDEVRISAAPRWTTDFTPPTSEYEDDVDTLFLLHANGEEGYTDFETDVRDSYVYDVDGNLEEHWGFANDEYKFYEYDSEATWPDSVHYQETYDLSSHVMDPAELDPTEALWFYDEEHLMVYQKHDIGTTGNAYQYYNMGQDPDGDNGYYREIQWEGDFTIYGYDSNDASDPTMQWQQLDGAYPGEAIDEMRTFEWYDGYENERVEWVNIYIPDGGGGWTYYDDPAGRSHHYTNDEANTYYETVDRTGVTVDAFKPSDIPAKPEFEDSALLSLEAGFTDEDVLLPDDMKDFFDKLDAIKADSTGEGVLVALLDSGLDAEKLDIDIAGGYDFAGSSRHDDIGDEDYSDSMGHGTETAEVFAETAPDADILAVKVMDNYGRTTSSIVADAIRYAVDAGARILSMPFDLLPVSSLLTDAINFALQNNVLLIAAAGNEGTEIKDSSLAAQEGVITVGSVDNDGRLSAWSNYGEEVDLYAPWDIIGNEQGTSFSAAYVAGIAALMLEDTPDMTRDELLEGLKSIFGEVGSEKVEEENLIDPKVEAEVLAKNNAVLRNHQEFTGYGPEMEGKYFKGAQQ